MTEIVRMKIGIYWFKQVSWRNRVLITFDWIKGRLFGRDIGNVKIYVNKRFLIKE